MKETFDFSLEMREVTGFLGGLRIVDQYEVVFGQLEKLSNILAELQRKFPESYISIEGNDLIGRLFSIIRIFYADCCVGDPELSDPLRSTNGISYEYGTDGNQWKASAFVSCEPIKRVEALANTPEEARFLLCKKIAEEI